MRARAVARETLVVAAYFALTAIVTYPLIREFRSAIPAGGDAWMNYWNLWWVKRALLDLHASPFFTPDVYYPYGASLYFHSLNLLPSVLALPVGMALGLPAANNFLVFVAFTFTGYGMYRLTLYVLAHEIDPSGMPAHPSAARLAAFVAGLAFTFSSYHFAHLQGHLELTSTEWLPFFVLFLLKIRDSRSWRNPIVCGILLAATALTAWYYMLFLLVFTGAFVVHTSLGRRRDALPAVARTALALAVFALLTSPVLMPMLILGGTAGRTPNPAADIVRFSTDALAFVIPSLLHPAWGRAVNPLYQTMFGKNAGPELVAFLGYVPLGLALAAALKYNATRTFWLITALLFALLALGPIAHVAGRAVPIVSPVMPYSVIVRLPYGDIPRAPVRFVVMAMLCLSVLAGCGTWFVLRNLSRSSAAVVTTVLAALVLLENAVVPLPMVIGGVPPFFDRLGRDPVRSAVLEVPIPDNPIVFPARMLFQTRHGKPVYGGYLSRGLPPLQFDALPGFRQFKALSPTVDDVVSYPAGQLPAISRRVLAAYGAGHVVIEKFYMPDAALVERARAIADELFGTSAREYEDKSTLAYAVPHDAAPGPAALWLDTGWSYLERADQRDATTGAMRWRWMAERARAAVLADVPTTARLRMTAMSFGRARRLKLSIGGHDITTLAIAQNTAAYETPAFAIPAGLAFVDLRSLDGAESPGTDPRSLSVAMFSIELEITSASRE